MIPLAPREEAVMQCLARGHSDAQIGRDLGITSNAVRSRTESILNKAGCLSRAELVRKAQELYPQKA